MNEAAISIRGVSKSYGRVQALRQLDLSVECGEIFGFLGPNGAGKTTTIRCLLDLIRPQQGEIRVMGIDPRRDPVAVRARCGYLPGELHIDDNLTVEAALRFFVRSRQGQSTKWSSMLRCMVVRPTSQIRVNSGSEQANEPTFSTG